MSGEIMFANTKQKNISKSVTESSFERLVNPDTF